MEVGLDGLIGDKPTFLLGTVLSIPVIQDTSPYDTSQTKQGTCRKGSVVTVSTLTIEQGACTLCSEPLHTEPVSHGMDSFNARRVRYKPVPWSLALLLGLRS